MRDIDNWIAEAKRGEVLHQAVVIIGPQASGKTIAANLLASFVAGGSFITEQDAKLNGFGSFANFVHMTRVMLLETPRISNDDMKSVVSETKFVVERKGENAQIVQRKCNFIITSGLFLQSEPDRRFIVAGPFDVIAAVTRAMQTGAPL